MGRQVEVDDSQTVYICRRELDLGDLLQVPFEKGLK